MLVNKGHWFLFTVDTVLQCPASVDQNSHWGEAHHAIVAHEFFMVFLLSSDYRPSVDRPSTECWPITDRYIGEVSTNYRRGVGGKSVRCRWSIGEQKAISAETHLERLSTVSRPSVVRLSSESQPTIDRYIDRVSTDYRPTIDWLSTECRPSVDRPSTAISTDRSVDTTYSKHDLEVWRFSRTKQRCSRVKQRQGKDKKACYHVKLSFVLISRKSVLHVQFVYLLIRYISLEAIFIVVPV